MPGGSHPQKLTVATGSHTWGGGGRGGERAQGLCSSCLEMLGLHCPFCSCVLLGCRPAA